jgi:hypothetical protein
MSMVVMMSAVVMVVMVTSGANVRRLRWRQS